ncbi:hypothetical protein INS49_003729 [Diaporthe citri]|uniref:uncharacterized protein n=1 Tax=Diaporthe citri TaxID=83186 RepID=UPI001C7E3D3F|nr:uncharacterized protein INS49_003729 [Diaporthe citri]KAG6355763.1 hypothetical protein INS49_003729 [Diaporthe citri]
MVYIASAWFCAAAVCTLFVTENGYIGRSRLPVHSDDHMCLTAFLPYSGLQMKPKSKSMTIIDGATDPSSRPDRFDDDEENGSRMIDETDRWSMELLPLFGFPQRRFDLI